jgi:hypothetical protein
MNFKKMNRLFTIPALALLLTMSGCNFSGKKASEAFPSKQAESETPDELLAADTQSAEMQSDEMQSDEAQSDSQEALLQRLTKNKGKEKSLELIAVHDGRVYSQLAWGSLSERGWQYVRGCEGLVIIGNSIIFMAKNEEHTKELYRTDLQGGNETLIYSGIDYNYVWIMGDRIIFRTENEVSDDNVTFKSVFCYDPATSVTTRLSKETIDEYFVVPISFDDNYVYYAKMSSGNDWRVRWDGTSDEELPFQLMRTHLVEGDVYYAVSYGEFADAPIGIEKFPINNNGQYGAFYIDHGWLIRIENGWAYYGYETGVFKMSMNNGDKVKLADLAPGETWHALGFKTSCIIGDDLYFNTEIADNQYGSYKLYKVPLNGGEMEFLDVAWEFGGKPVL